MNHRFKDITGQRFGSLTALRYSHTKNGMAYWVYHCDCGKEHTARSNMVTHQVKVKNDPELPSCGCVELSRKTKHGFRKAKDTHPAYRTYRGMMDRCYNPSVIGYQWYGAKGVTVCDEWKNSPEAFVKWAISNGWKPGLHIDKDILCQAKGISPHIYSPETCQWVSAQVNVATATNRDNYGKHPNIKLSYDEVAQLLDDYHSKRITSYTELARKYGLLSPNSAKRLVFQSHLGAA